MRSLGWRVGFRVKRRNLESLSGEGKKKCGFWRKGNFFSGILLFFFFLWISFIFFFFSFPNLKRKEEEILFFFVPVYWLKAPFWGSRESEFFMRLKREEFFFFYYQEADFHFFLNFRLGLLRVIQAVSALLVEMSLEEKLKKMILHLSFFFCFEET